MLRVLSKLPLQGVYRTCRTQALSTVSSVDDIIITDRCVSQLKKVALQNECLRVAVEGGGCSGFEYKMSLDSEINADDKIFEKDGTIVIVDKTSFEFVKGATIDYSEELIRSAFRIIKNPIAEKGCSCGTSFAVKMD
ncbi:hypothetical protein L596_015010 [Steinernema carpocapsae]|uniref:Iron-sulfur cluster assembly 2 homolog, mitochondrial n=1 Tax=Steinernema carpocapsae TaxID=34508 RepID=A0A4U5NEJ8_STECR|nr:hypothetical protein L596_015010 [Steinernema carpocapsae]